MLGWDSTKTKTRHIFCSSLTLVSSGEILALHTHKRSPVGRKEGNVLFNDALNTFYLRLYGVGHMVKDHSDSERGNPRATLSD